jgi:hypothetical protein
LAMILLGMESKVILRQSLQLFILPFFGILTTTPWFHSSGTLMSFQMSWNIGCKMVASRCGSALKRYAFKLLLPGALPFLGS